jgi:molybdate transport system substrate-binding protein
MTISGLLATCTNTCSTHPPINYPIAMLASSTNGVAPIYVQYLRSPKAAPFFEKQGFVVQ